MYATASFTCSKQVVDVEQQVILEERKFYINWHKYFCPLRRVINNILVLDEVVRLFKIWRAFMVGDAPLLILLPLETRQVAPDNTVVLTLKLRNQT